MTRQRQERCIGAQRFANGSRVRVGDAIALEGQHLKPGSSAAPPCGKGQSKREQHATRTHVAERTARGLALEHTAQSQWQTQEHVGLAL